MPTNIGTHKHKARTHWGTTSHLPAATLTLATSHHYHNHHMHRAPAQKQTAIRISERTTGSQGIIASWQWNCRAYSLCFICLVCTWVCTPMRQFEGSYTGEGCFQKAKTGTTFVDVKLPGGALAGASASITCVR